MMLEFDLESAEIVRLGFDGGNDVDDEIGDCEGFVDDGDTKSGNVHGYNYNTKGTGVVSI